MQCDYVMRTGAACGKTLPGRCAPGRTRCAAHIDKGGHKMCGCGKVYIQAVAVMCPHCHYRACARRKYAEKKAAKNAAVDKKLESVKNSDAVVASLRDIIASGVSADDLVKRLEQLALAPPLASGTALQ